MKRSIFKLAIPSIIENILQIMLSSVDTYFVSTIGSVAISAVGINTLISNLYLTFFIAVGAGVAILTARADGEENIEKVNHAIQNGLLLTMVLIVISLIFNLLFKNQLISFLAKEEPLITQTILYFNVVILPIGFLCLMTVLSTVIKSLNDTKTPMYTVLLINIVNVILDFILIRVLDFGLLGAGIATSIARLLGCMILWFTLNKKTAFIKTFEFKFKKGIRDMIAYAIPLGGEKLAMRIGQLFYGSLIVTIGIKHYTGHNIAGTIEAYSYLPGMGFGIAAFAMIGHSIGSESFKDVRKIGLQSFKYSTIFMMIIGAFFFIFAPHLASLFTQDQEIIKLVTIVLRLIACFQPFLCSTQVIASALQSLGDVKFPFYLTIIGIYLIRLLGTYILGIQFGLGLIGVWISYTIDITIRGTILFIRYLKKTNIDLLRKEYQDVRASS